VAAKPPKDLISAQLHVVHKCIDGEILWKGSETMRKPTFVVLAVALILSTFLGACQAMQFGREAGKAAVTPTTLPLEVKPEELFPQTEEVKVCDVVLRITNVDLLPEEKDGKDLVLVSVEVRNEGDATAPVNQLDFYLFDSEGTANATAILSVEDQLRSPRLEPGESASGVLPYLVASGSEELKLNWSPGWCVDRAIIELD
jgi:hypothetical protein